MRSGALNVAAFRPSAAFSASRTANPLRRNRLILGSSSITSTTFADLLIGQSRQAGIFHPAGGQHDGCGGAKAFAMAGDFDGAAVGADEGRRDPEAEARARNRFPVARAAKRPLAEFVLL